MKIKTATLLLFAALALSLANAQAPAAADEDLLAGGPLSQLDSAAPDAAAPEAASPDSASPEAAAPDSAAADAAAPDAAGPDAAPLADSFKQILVSAPEPSNHAHLPPLTRARVQVSAVPTHACGATESVQCTLLATLSQAEFAEGSADCLPWLDCCRQARLLT